MWMNRALSRCRYRRWWLAGCFDQCPIWNESFCYNILDMLTSVKEAIFIIICIQIVQFIITVQFNILFNNAPKFTTINYFTYFTSRTIVAGSRTSAWPIRAHAGHTKGWRLFVCYDSHWCAHTLWSMGAHHTFISRFMRLIN